MNPVPLLFPTMPKSLRLKTGIHPFPKRGTFKVVIIFKRTKMEQQLGLLAAQGGGKRGGKTANLAVGFHSFCFVLFHFPSIHSISFESFIKIDIFSMGLFHFEKLAFSDGKALC